MRWRTGIAGVVLLLYTGVGNAEGGIQVNPIGVELAPGEQVATFTLTNHDDSPHAFQAQPMEWTDPDGRQRLSPSQRLIASPALFRLAAGGSQIVRVGFAVPQPAKPVERAFRVLFSELPEDQSSQTDAVGIHILLRINVPIFYASSAHDPASHLIWTLRQAPHEWQLRVKNDGDRHARISALGLTLGGHDQVQKKGLWYVLAGEQRSWTFSHPASSAPTTATIHVDTDQGTISQTIVPSPG